MKNPYSPPTSNLAVRQVPRKRALRVAVGFMSGVLAIPALAGLSLLIFLLWIGSSDVSFSSKDLPAARGWVLLFANGALCALLAARFTRYPLWIVASSGFALPALVFLAILAMALVRLAA